MLHLEKGCGGASSRPPLEDTPRPQPQPSACADTAAATAGSLRGGQSLGGTRRWRLDGPHATRRRGTLPDGTPPAFPAPLLGRYPGIDAASLPRDGCARRPLRTSVPCAGSRSLCRTLYRTACADQLTLTQRMGLSPTARTEDSSGSASDAGMTGPSEARGGRWQASHLWLSRCCISPEWGRKRIACRKFMLGYDFRTFVSAPIGTPPLAPFAIDEEFVLLSPLRSIC